MEFEKEVATRAKPLVEDTKLYKTLTGGLENN